MGKLNVVISDKLDERFREAIFRAKGLKKGNLTDAVEEAIELWIKSQIDRKRKVSEVRVKPISK